MQALIQFCAEPNTNAADQTGTVSSSVITLKSLLSGGAFHADTRFVRVSVDANTDDLRMTIAGATPTSTLGRLITAGSSVLLSTAEADNAKLLRVTADSRVQIAQYRN